MKNKILFVLVIAMLISTIVMPTSMAQEAAKCNVSKDIKLSQTEIDCIQNMLTVCNKNDIATLFPELQGENSDMSKYELDVNTALNVVCSEYNISCDEDTSKDELLEDITEKIVDNNPEVVPIVSAQPTPNATNEIDKLEETQVPALNQDIEDITIKNSEPTTTAVPVDAADDVIIMDEDNSDTIFTDEANDMQTEDIMPMIPMATPDAAPDAEETAQPTSTNEIIDNQNGISTLEMEMIIMVNEDRANAGLPPLTASADLSQKAREHSLDMSGNNFFSHTSPTRGGFSERLRNSGLSYMSAGENIALYNSVEKALICMNCQMSSVLHVIEIKNIVMIQSMVG